MALATRLILQQAGITPGMRVLDLGTGTGAVARLAAELVGPSGSVVGLDRQADALHAAEQRRRADGATNIRFVEGDVDSWDHDGDFDAVIGRLILFHLRDPAAALAHHARSLRPGAHVVAMDLDASAVRSVPATPTVTETRSWMLDGFRRVGANPTIGSRLGELLESAGLHDPIVLGFTTYHSPHDADGPLLLAGVVRSLLAVIERSGTAVGADIDADTLPRARRRRAHVVERRARPTHARGRVGRGPAPRRRPGGGDARPHPHVRLHPVLVPELPGDVDDRLLITMRPS